MQARFFSEGKTLDFSPGADVAAGTVVVVGGLVGVANTFIPANTLGALSLIGCYRVNKAAQAMTLGAELYWDDTNNRVTTTASGNTPMGHCVEAAAEAATETVVRLVQ